MHFKHFSWTTKKLNDLRSGVDPKPQYQRGDAWDDKNRALLIDSILGNFDIPKIYLRHAKNIGTFDYEVADGQQRLKALWQFFDDKLVLQGMSEGNAHFNGRVFSDFTENEKQQITNYELVTTVVYNATNDEVRELFRRLQLGVRLNPAEIRNSMASALGTAIRAMAITHSFFKNSPFSTSRYKSDDMLAHAFAVVIYKRTRDMKAPDLKEMYIEYSKTVDSRATKKVNEILSFLDRVQHAEPDCIKTKLVFLDLVDVLAKRNLSRLSVTGIAEHYLEWERERAEKMSDLPTLARVRRGSRARKLYEYIAAFQKEGATKKNLDIRFRILNSILPR